MNPSLPFSRSTTRNNARSHWISSCFFIYHLSSSFFSSYIIIFFILQNANLISIAISTLQCSETWTCLSFPVFIFPRNLFQPIFLISHVQKIQEMCDFGTPNSSSTNVAWSPQFLNSFGHSIVHSIPPQGRKWWHPWLGSASSQATRTDFEWSAWDRCTQWGYLWMTIPILARSTAQVGLTSLMWEFPSASSASVLRRNSRAAHPLKEFKRTSTSPSSSSFQAYSWS